MGKLQCKGRASAPAGETLPGEVEDRIGMTVLTAKAAVLEEAKTQEKR